MAEYFSELVHPWHWSALIATMVISILFLGKGADWLVEEAVALSLRSGLPRVVVGATIVSLGTTTPEAVVSVLAAVQGEPGLALGNAVGSIICDTGLILGLACLIAPLPINRHVVNRQGWVQFGSGVLLVVLCLPWLDLMSTTVVGGTLAQLEGWILVALLAGYLVWSVRLARKAGGASDVDEASILAPRSMLGSVGRIIGAVLLVLISSSFLIATATELAERLHVPPSVVAATLVAFGTSLPELTIVITSVLKGHGELAVGNVIGADILNVLFVAGMAAAVTPSGLAAEPHFFVMQFPAMLFVLMVFRVGIWTARDDQLRRPFGMVLVIAYVAVTVLSYISTGGMPH